MRISDPKLSLAALLLCFFIYACQNTMLEESAFMTRLEKADTPFSKHAIDTRQGGMITMPSGSSIEIPANAFVDANGTPIKGEVSIEYREFHDAGSILASGIPMEYTENGKTHTFQTAGMFEIRGYTTAGNTMQLMGGGEGLQPVFLAAGKTLNTNIASFAKEEGYNFYFFNEKTKQWEFRQKSVAVPNEAKQKVLEEEAPMPDSLPAAPQEFDKNTPVFDLDVSLKDFPEMKEFKGIVWQYAGKTDADNPNSPANKWVGSIAWTSINITPVEGESVFEVTFVDAKGQKTFVTYLKPVLRGNDYDKAMEKFQKKLAKYEEAKAKRVDAEVRRSAEGNFIRNAAINGFGIYNHDALYRMENAVACNARFSLANGEEIKQTAFVMAAKNTVLLRYETSQWGNFNYPKSDAVIMVILEDGQLAVMSRADLEQQEVKKGDSHKFLLQVVNGVNTSEELASAVRNLW